MPSTFASTACRTASDGQIFDRAADEDRVVVSADTDFGTLLAARRSSRPSVLLFRHGTERHPAQQAALLVANLTSVETAVQEGALVVIEPGRLRVRQLPLLP